MLPHHFHNALKLSLASTKLSKKALQTTRYLSLRLREDREEFTSQSGSTCKNRSSTMYCQLSRRKKAQCKNTNNTVALPTCLRKLTVGWSMYLRCSNSKRQANECCYVWDGYPLNYCLAPWFFIRLAAKRIPSISCITKRGVGENAIVGDPYSNTDI